MLPPVRPPRPAGSATHRTGPLVASLLALSLATPARAALTLVDPQPGVDDHAGAAVAITATAAVLGAPGSDVGAVNAGRVVVLDPATGAFVRALANPAPAVGDNFGGAVVATASQIVVGAPGDDAGAVDAGSVYVFDAATGVLQRTIPNPAPATFDAFGSALALSGSLLVVGAPEDDQGANSAGSAYLFDVNTGALLRTLSNPTPGVSDFFGAAVSTDGALVVVGAPQDDAGAGNAGAAHVFDAATGALVRTLTNPTPASSDLFGTAVAIDGSAIVVGAPEDDTAANNAGAAYLFATATGALIATLQDPVPGGGEFFGGAIAASGSSILVGEASDDLGADRAGSAHVFSKSSGAFLQTLANPSPTFQDFAGSAVALTSGRALIGVPQDDPGVANAGTAYADRVAVCGDGLVELDEQCEDGNLLDGDCCSASCHFDAPGTACTDDGNVCSSDSCDGAGVCTHPPGHAGATCRSAASACDVAEVCTGASTSCPGDAFAGAGSACPDDGNPCSLDECDGGGACLHPPGNAGAVCRALAGECDVVETCTGGSTSCPADGFRVAGEGCTDDANPCSLDQCDGSGACTHPAGNPGVVCRGAAGACDVAESCTGSSSACPADVFVTAGTVCRAVSDACDLAEACSGTSAPCPSDSRRPDGDGDGACDLIDNCDLDANLDQSDQDGDGLGDACDPCTSLAPPVLAPARLSLAKVLAPGGDDRLGFTGTATFDTFPPIDPVLKGVRLVLQDASGGVVLDAILPGGAFSTATKRGWRAAASGNRYTFRDGGPNPVGGIASVSLRQTGGVAGRFAFRIAGKKGTYPAAGVALPLRLTIVLDAPIATTGQCAVSGYATGDCTPVTGGSGLRCN